MNQSSVPAVSLGARTLNIGTIPVNRSAEISATIFPSSAAGGTLQNLGLEISYNDASGNRKSTTSSLGFRVLPNPPEGGLTVTPSAYSSANAAANQTVVAASTITGSPAADDSINNAANAGSSNNNNRSSKEAAIIAGRPDDLNFTITNNNRNPITDVVVTLAPRSDSVDILGDSRWNLHELSPQSSAQFTTRVFASDSLIGKPVSFEVGVQYISGDQVKSDSFSLGSSVMGDIEIEVNDLAVSYVAGVPNLTGSLLNKGNTAALFTTIGMQIEPTTPAKNNNKGLVPTTYTPQYQGDLEENSPLPISIPLAISNSSLDPGNYPVSLVVTYSDDLRNTHEVIFNKTVSFTPRQQEESTSNQGFLGFGSSSGVGGRPVNFVLIAAIIAAAAVVAAIILIRRRRRSRTKLAKLTRNSQKGNNGDFEASMDEYLSSSSHKEEGESSEKK